MPTCAAVCVVSSHVGRVIVSLALWVGLVGGLWGSSKPGQISMTDDVVHRTIRWCLEDYGATQSVGTAGGYVQVTRLPVKAMWV